MGREISYKDLEEETSFTIRGDKYKAISGLQVSRFMNSLHRVIGHGFGILPSSSGPKGYSRSLQFDCSTNTFQEVEEHLRNQHPFRNDIGYFPTADFQYSQCQDNIPEFYLTSQSSMEGYPSFDSMLEDTFRNASPQMAPLLQTSPHHHVTTNLHYPSPLIGMYTFFVPVYPCYVLIPAVQETQTNMRN